MITRKNFNTKKNVLFNESALSYPVKPGLTSNPTTLANDDNVTLDTYTDEHNEKIKYDKLDRKKTTAFDQHFAKIQANFTEH